MIQGCMSGIPEATPIVLTAEERAELEGLARSTKTEHRLRQRAGIVLMAAEGAATRAIARAVHCTTGTASTVTCTCDPATKQKLPSPFLYHVGSAPSTTLNNPPDHEDGTMAPKPGNTIYSTWFNLPQEGCRS